MISKFPGEALLSPGCYAGSLVSLSSLAVLADYDAYAGCIFFLVDYAGWLCWLFLLAALDGKFCCLNWPAFLAMQAARLCFIYFLVMFSVYAVRADWTC
jgi:hypothetical protein